MGVQKMGTKPVQRDQFEYEFQVVFSVDMEHKATTSKDNSGLFEGMDAKLSPDVGKKLSQWLDTGVDIFAERRAKEAEQNLKRLALIDDMYNQLQDHDDIKELVAWVDKMQKHPTLNKPLEDMSYDVLTKFHNALLAEIEKYETTKTQEEGN
jgi:hypothetical protein